MKKFLRVIENVGLGLFVNGSYSIVADTLSLQNLILTAVAMYAMIVAVVFQED
jgi:hypothetical protein